MSLWTHVLPILPPAAATSSSSRARSSRRLRRIGSTTMVCACCRRRACLCYDWVLGSWRGERVMEGRFSEHSKTGSIPIAHVDDVDAWRLAMHASSLAASSLEPRASSPRLLRWIEAAGVGRSVLHQNSTRGGNVRHWGVPSSESVRLDRLAVLCCQTARTTTRNI